jgi:hypothetical protein
MFLSHRAHAVLWKNARVTLFIIGLFCMQICASTIVWGATEEVVYQSDFASDPHWITDQPENFYWDSTKGALFAHTNNQPDSNYSPSRHYYTKTTLNPALSYELTWDMQILKIEGGNTSGVAVFGLYGNRLYGFNPLNLNFAGNDQDGTFSMRLMTLDGSSRYVFTEVNPGFNYDIGEQKTYSFGIGTWYTLTERYAASTHEYYFEIKDRASGNIVFTNVVHADTAESVNPDLQNLGISMHPEGTGATNLAYSSRIDGFAEYLIDNVTLTQIYEETYTEPSSVLFLPGIQASRLYKDGLLGSEDQLWEPNINNDVAQLEMTDTGESVRQIYTRDVVDTALDTYDIYGSFETYLNTIKSSGIISDWVPYAYDWRYAVSDVVRDGTQYEGEKKKLIEIVERLAKSNNSHVTIIAHSNGGLLAKTLLTELEVQGKAHLIDKVIFVASPQLGTPKAIGSVLHGLDQEILGGIIADDETAREVMRNFPGVYGLVPSEEYVARAASPLVRFESGATLENFVNAYGATVDSAEELRAFMVGAVDGRPMAQSINEASDANEAMLTTAQAMHRNTLDTWIAPAHVQVIEIVGVGLDTVKGFQYREFTKQTCVPAGGSVACAYDPYYEPVPVPVLTQYGDETVVSLSAEAYEGDKQTYYVNLKEVADTDPDVATVHSNITELPSLQQFLGGILQNTTVLAPFIYGTKPSFNTSREIISVHSPVKLSLTDTSGRVVGKVGEGEGARIMADIPGSSYFEIGGATYIIVPSTTNYTAQVQGVGEEGSYSLGIELLQGENQPASIVSLASATVTPNMEASFTKVGDVRSELVTDYDGDGIVDATIQIAPEPASGELFSGLRTMVGEFVLLKAKDRTWLLNSLSKAETTGINKGYASSAVLRIIGQIDAKMTQHVSSGKVTAAEYNVFMTFVNKIKTY